MKFSLWTKYGALNSKPVFNSFRIGATRLGFRCADNAAESDVDVIWSVLWAGRMRPNQDIWLRARKRNKPVIVIEVGGIQRNTTWRIGLNGVNRDAYFAPEGNDDARAKLLGLELKPWRHSGEFVLICGQHERSQQWQGLPPMSQWLDATVREIRNYTDRPIVFRPHPRSPVRLKNTFRNFTIQTPLKKTGTYDDYEINFNGSWAVINACSNPGIHAAIAGIPVFVNQSSLAYPVGNSDLRQIESPQMPDRTQWLNDLAHKEYTIEEIQQGIPLKYLTNQLR